MLFFFSLSHSFLFFFSSLFFSFLLSYQKTKTKKKGTLCDKFCIQGTYEWVDEEKHRESNTIGDTIHVTELPAGKWVNDYKQFLEEGPCLLMYSLP